jgi:hypothetical protein
MANYFKTLVLLNYTEGLECGSSGRVAAQHARSPGFNQREREREGGSPGGKEQMSHTGTQIIKIWKYLNTEAETESEHPQSGGLSSLN